MGVLMCEHGLDVRPGGEGGEWLALRALFGLL